MYEDHLSMNPSPSGSTIKSRRGGYVFALSRTPSIEDSQTQSVFGNSYAISSPGLLAEHHGQISSTSTSRRSSISNNATTKHTTATSPHQRVRKRDRMLQFAKMKNPTLSIQITPEWIVDFTYAELLQYASMILTGRRIIQFYWPLEIDPKLNSGTTTSLQHLLKTPVIVYWNMVFFIIASASIEGRKRAEQLGLRRTCLMLCLVLFACSSVVALWPVEKIDQKIMLQHLNSEKDNALRIPDWTPDDSAIQICHRSSGDRNSKCSEAELPDMDISQLIQPCSEKHDGKTPSFIRLRTNDDHTVLVLCNNVHVQQIVYTTNER